MALSAVQRELEVEIPDIEDMYSKFKVERAENIRARKIIKAALEIEDNQ